MRDISASCYCAQSLLDVSYCMRWITLILRLLYVDLNNQLIEDNKPSRIRAIVFKGVVKVFIFAVHETFCEQIYAN